MQIWRYAVVVLPALYMVLGAGGASLAFDEYDPAESVVSQHAKDMKELGNIRDSLSGIKSEMGDALESMSTLQQQVAAQRRLKEFQLVAKELSYQFAPGCFIQCLGYSGSVPGPVIRVQEGDPVRITVINRLKVPTSLYIQGAALPRQVDGLALPGAGLIAPGESNAYQFTAPCAGTYWYHPQIMHGDQQDLGLYGTIVVEPRTGSNPPELDQVLVLGKWYAVKIRETGGTNGKVVYYKATSPAFPNLQPGALNFFTVNGKCAPLIPAIEVTYGNKVRLRVVNTACDTIPLTLMGHQLMEYGTAMDVAPVEPGCVRNLEFSAGNPGVWSLCSTVPAQNANQGSFPGGVACVVRYER